MLYFWISIVHTYKLLALKTSNAFDKLSARTFFITRAKIITSSKTIAGFPTALSCDWNVSKCVRVPSHVLPNNCPKFILRTLFPETTRRCYLENSCLVHFLMRPKAQNYCQNFWKTANKWYWKSWVIKTPNSYHLWPLKPI